MDNLMMILPSLALFAVILTAQVYTLDKFCKVAKKPWKPMRENIK